MRRDKAKFAQTMRDNPTPSERQLWRCLRKGIYGVQFKSQEVIRGYILDFYAPEIKLGIELDGFGHQAKRDTQRDSNIAKEGITVMRFRNPRSHAGFWHVLARVRAECRWRIGRKRKGLPHSFPQRVTPLSHYIDPRYVKFSTLSSDSKQACEISGSGKVGRSHGTHGQFVKESDTKMAQELRKNLCKPNRQKNCIFCRGTGWVMSGDRPEKCQFHKQVLQALPAEAYL